MPLKRKKSNGVPRHNILEILLNSFLISNHEAPSVWPEAFEVKKKALLRMTFASPLSGNYRFWVEQSVRFKPPVEVRYVVNQLPASFPLMKLRQVFFLLIRSAYLLWSLNSDHLCFLTVHTGHASSALEIEDLRVLLILCANEMQSKKTSLELLKNLPMPSG